MDTLALVVLVIAILLIVISLPFVLARKKKAISTPLPVAFKKILEAKVPFYQQLDVTKQKEFEERVQLFLSRTRITGVKTEIDDEDKILIGASAIIPIFGFANWEYNNVDEILLYPDSFNEEFDQQGGDRQVLGVVGNGAYEDLMILSRHELKQAFLNKTAKTNTAIHEFTHLLDKTDGSVDGIPENLIPHRYIKPWVELMHRNIKQILANKSDINPYGATNTGEFFAVVSEYFFERPELLKQKHPDLYEILSTIFRQQPVTILKK